MPRPSQIEEQRKRLLPVVCEVFSEFGYRRTTTAELARRCEVRENILYRLWPNKKAMFLAALENIFERRVERWEALQAKLPSPDQAGDALVAYEAKHMGESGFYRVVFTALVEADDPEIRIAIASMYRRFHERLVALIELTRQGGADGCVAAESAAWAMIGLATVSNIIKELKLLRPGKRKAVFTETAKYLIDGLA